jgi:hypothetical protein
MIAARKAKELSGIICKLIMHLYSQIYHFHVVFQMKYLTEKIAQN